jgi:amino acid transporter
MASTGIDHLGASKRSIVNNEKYDETPIARGVDDDAPGTYSPGDDDSIKPLSDHTHRKLKPRHIQLIGIGGYVEEVRIHLHRIER